MEEFRARLKRLRERKGVSRKTVSQLCGCSSDVVRRWESGYAEPSFRSINALADYFEVSTDYLMCRTDNPKKF